MKFLLGMFLFLIICCSSNADDVLRKQFLAEYPGAESRLRKHYGTLKIAAEITSENKNDTEHPLTHLKCTYIANNAFVRIDREVLDGAEKYQGASSFVIGPQGPFIVDRKLRSTMYHIRSADESSLGIPSQRLSRMTSLSSVSFSPFSCDNSKGPIIDLLKDRSFIVEDVSLVEVGSSLVRVKWKFRSTLPRAVGEWVFDSSRSWILVSHKSRSQMENDRWHDFENIITVGYGDAVGDVPLVTSYESVIRNFASGEIVGRDYSKVTEIVPSNASADQFTLAAFGLRYEQGVPENRTGKWLVIAGLFGIGSVVLGRWIFSRWRPTL